MATTLQKYRPADESSAALRAAISGLAAERTAQVARIADQTERRAALLLDGSDKEIAAAESAVADAMLTVERIDAFAPELQRRLAEAIAGEAAEAHRQKVREAIAAIETFNTWAQEHYEAHAKAIAEGIALEKEAWRHVEALRHAGVTPEGLPARARGYVGRTEMAFSSLVRLPAIRPGAPIFWQ